MTPGGDRAIVVDSDYENKFTESHEVVPRMFYEQERGQSLDGNGEGDASDLDDAANADVTLQKTTSPKLQNGCCRDCMKAFSKTGKVSNFITVIFIRLELFMPGA